MHRKRLIVALVLIPLLYLYVMYLPSRYFLYLLVFFSTIGLAEYYEIVGIRGALRFIGLGLGALLLTVFFIRKDFFAETIVFSVMIMTAARLFLKRDPAGAIREMTAAGFGLLYLPCLLSVQLDLARTGPAWLVMLYAAVWASDSMAYYVGTSIGRRKLYVEVSPNKTVEGAVGSVIGGIAGAMLIKLTLLGSVSVPEIMLLGAAVGSATIIGDLVESLIKRDAGVKDSGSIMPGHGGILDKLDGVTFAGPAFFWCASLLGLLSAAG